MKIALYIEDGLEQVVLTPESKIEADILSKIHDGSRNLELRRGDFYECRGGWVRWKQPRRTSGLYSFGGDTDHDESTMIVLRPASGMQLREDAQAAEGEALQPGPEGETPQ